MSYLLDDTERALPIGHEFCFVRFFHNRAWNQVSHLKGPLPNVLILRSSNLLLIGSEPQVGFVPLIFDLVQFPSNGLVICWNIKVLWSK